jgi:phosphoribosylanthranilate isomerase
METSKELKIVQLHSQQVIKAITQLAEEAGEERILKLVQVVSDDVKGNNKYGHVWYVLDLVATSLVKVVQDGGLQCDDH